MGTLLWDIFVWTLQGERMLGLAAHGRRLLAAFSAAAATGLVSLDADRLRLRWPSAGYIACEGVRALCARAPCARACLSVSLRARVGLAHCPLTYHLPSLCARLLATIAGRGNVACVLLPE